MKPRLKELYRCGPAGPVWVGWMFFDYRVGLIFKAYNNEE
jgi:hypothetical protein